MATTIGQGEIAWQEGWVRPADRSLSARIFSGIWNFAKRKPLGAFCGFIVLVFCIVGDLVPETINSATDLVGLGRPVPYLADTLHKNTDVVYFYSQQDLRNRLKGASSDHLLGTDQLGRDIFSRLLYGARVAVLVPLGAEAIAVTLATMIGIMSAFYGGWYDKLFFRLVDMIQALPGLVLLITILGVFGSGLWAMIFAIGLISWPTGARLIRAQTISVMASPYLESARVIGAGNFRMMARYVLPNVFALIVLYSTLRLGAVVLIEATLSFLGFGLAPPFPSWGQMLSLEGREFMRSQPGLAIWPGLAIGLLVFSYNLFGDAIRDVLDPRLRGTR